MARRITDRHPVPVVVDRASALLFVDWVAEHIGRGYHPEDSAAGLIVFSAPYDPTVIYPPLFTAAEAALIDAQTDRAYAILGESIYDALRDAEAARYGEID